MLATAIAKYVRNAQREAILLEVCHAGIVFLPGRAGTVQEVFQDACENFYADESSVAPMVLVGGAYWTETVPAWPLLETLARGRPMEPHVHLVDEVDEAAEPCSGAECRCRASGEPGTRSSHSDRARLTAGTAPPRPAVSLAPFQPLRPVPGSPLLN